MVVDTQTLMGKTCVGLDSSNLNFHIFALKVAELLEFGQVTRVYLSAQMTVTVVRLTVLHVDYQHRYMTFTDIGNQLHSLTTF